MIEKLTEIRETLKKQLESVKLKAQFLFTAVSEHTLTEKDFDSICGEEATQRVINEFTKAAYLCLDHDEQKTLLNVVLKHKSDDNINEVLKHVDEYTAWINESIESFYQEQDTYKLQCDVIRHTNNYARNLLGRMGTVLEDIPADILKKVLINILTNIDYDKIHNIIIGQFDNGKDDLTDPDKVSELMREALMENDIETAKKYAKILEDLKGFDNL